MKALFIVPRLRTSAYLTNLSEAIPALMSSQPGNISISELPELRHIIVVPNSSEDPGGALESLPCSVNFRDVLIWDESRPKLSTSLHRDDIINLQFTRWIF